jgi:putative transposase
MMEYYRNLPHLQPIEAIFFVTARLHGSLPKKIVEQLQEEHQCELARLSKDNTESGKQKLINHHKRHFARMDEELDKNAYGPKWLGDSQIAQLVAESIHHRHNVEYNLIAYCLMSNHYHLVIDTRRLGNSERPLYRLLQSLNRYTARKANQFLNRTGHFWFGENYDHIVRNDAELKRIIQYVLQNPVKVGLVDDWQAWPYSFVNEAYL